MCTVYIHQDNDVMLDSLSADTDELHCSHLHVKNYSSTRRSHRTTPSPLINTNCYALSLHPVPCADMSDRIHRGPLWPWEEDSPATTHRPVDAGEAAGSRKCKPGVSSEHNSCVAYALISRTNHPFYGVNASSLCLLVTRNTTDHSDWFAYDLFVSTLCFFLAAITM